MFGGIQFSKLLSKKENIFFVKFIGLFFFLYFAYSGYVGLTVPGGSYSPFLVKYFDIVHWFAAFIAKAAKFFLEIIGFNVYQKFPSHLSIEHSKGVHILFPCLGVTVMSFWVAFVFANKGTWLYKLKWKVVGIVSIMLLNITRITLIALANHFKWKTITSLDHHQTFNIFSYGCIFLLMYWYIRIQKKYEAVADSNGYYQKHALRPV